MKNEKKPRNGLSMGFFRYKKLVNNLLVNQFNGAGDRT